MIYLYNAVRPQAVYVTCVYVQILTLVKGEYNSHERHETVCRGLL